MAIPSIQPYPMPLEAQLPESYVDWQPEAGRCALLIHDMQRYYLDFFPSGAAPVTELVDNIGALRRQCHRYAVPVFYSVQGGSASIVERGLLLDFWGSGMKADVASTAILDPLIPLERDTIIQKHRYSAFHRTKLLEQLQLHRRDQLIICGVYAHIGCLATALDAFMHDIQVFMVADALADFSAAEHHMALQYAAKRCASVCSTLDTMKALELNGSLKERTCSND